MNRFSSTAIVGDLTSTTCYNFKVDKTSEGVIPAQFYKENDFTVKQPNAPSSAMDWYFMYKTDNTAYSNTTITTSTTSSPSTNGLSCYLLPDNSYTIKQTGTSSQFSLNLNDYCVQDRHYFLTGDAGGRITFTVSSTDSGDQCGTAKVNYNGADVT
jgi:hypothetical protein